MDYDRNQLQQQLIKLGTTLLPRVQKEIAWIETSYQHINYPGVSVDRVQRIRETTMHTANHQSNGTAEDAVRLLRRNVYWRSMCS